MSELKSCAQFCQLILSQVKAPEPVHGRLSELRHSGHALLQNIPSGPSQGFDTVRCVAVSAWFVQPVPSLRKNVF